MTAELTAAEAINQLWNTCDDGWWIRAICDQWWVANARCPHGQWAAASNGALDIDNAFHRLAKEVIRHHDPTLKAPPT